MARTALIGSNGQLGSDIASLWSQSQVGRRDELVGLTHADFDVTDLAQVRSVLSGIQPDMVINTAAFHRVDDCEVTPELAFEVNGVGVKNLATVCRELGATLTHFSTDYVFSGDSATPYLESDQPRPASAYGVSKVAGEFFLRYLLPDNFILVRSSGLYGVAGASGKGGNFVQTMVRMAREGRDIRVVQDQICAPTYTLDIAATLLEVLQRGGRGIFHITNSGRCSWYEFAQTIFDYLNLHPSLTPITSGEFAARANRPAFSVLENGRLGQIGIEQPRPWREALGAYLRQKGELVD